MDAILEDVEMLFVPTEHCRSCGECIVTGNWLKLYILKLNISHVTTEMQYFKGGLGKNV